MKEKQTKATDEELVKLKSYRLECYDSFTIPRKLGCFSSTPLCRSMLEAVVTWKWRFGNTHK